MEPRDLSCPFCDADDTEQVGQWGGQMITAQWRCRACGSYFEAIRDRFDAPRGSERGVPPVDPAEASIDPK